MLKPVAGKVVTCKEKFQYKFKNLTIEIVKGDKAKVTEYDDKDVGLDIIESKDKQAENRKIALSRFEFNTLFK